MSPVTGDFSLIAPLYFLIPAEPVEPLYIPLPFFTQYHTAFNIQSAIQFIAKFKFTK